MPVGSFPPAQTPFSHPVEKTLPDNPHYIMPAGILQKSEPAPEPVWDSQPGKGKRSPLQRRFRRSPDPASYSHIMQWIFLRECSLPGGSRLYVPNF